MHNALYIKELTNVYWLELNQIEIKQIQLVGIILNENENWTNLESAIMQDTFFSLNWIKITFSTKNKISSFMKNHLYLFLFIEMGRSIVNGVLFLWIGNILVICANLYIRL